MNRYFMLKFCCCQDKSRQTCGGWILGKVVGVLPKGGNFIRPAEGPNTEDVFLGPSLVPKSMPAFQVPVSTSEEAGREREAYR